MITKEEMKNKLIQIDAAYENIMEGINPYKEMMNDVAYGAIDALKDAYQKFYSVEIERQLNKIKRLIDAAVDPITAGKDRADYINKAGLIAIDLLSAIYPEVEIEKKEFDDNE